MVAYLVNGCGLANEFETEATLHIGQTLPETSRVVTVQLDGDELEAFKWGMANYKKEAPARTETIYITPAGWICTCEESQSTPTGASASRNGYAHSQTHANPARIIDTRK